MRDFALNNLLLSQSLASTVDHKAHLRNITTASTTINELLDLPVKLIPQIVSRFHELTVGHRVTKYEPSPGEGYPIETTRYIRKEMYGFLTTLCSDAKKLISSLPVQEEKDLAAVVFIDDLRVVVASLEVVWRGLTSVMRAHVTQENMELVQSVWEDQMKAAAEVAMGRLTGELKVREDKGEAVWRAQAREDLRGIKKLMPYT